jgi:hypothetical protein
MDRDERYKREGVTIIDDVLSQYQVEVTVMEAKARAGVLPRNWEDLHNDGNETVEEHEAKILSRDLVVVQCESWWHEPDGEQIHTESSKKWDSLVMHRLVGPARTLLEWETDKLIREEYFNNGYRHRLAHEGPAFRAISDLTDVVYMEDYYENDVLHNPHGPALIRRDTETGKTIIEDFYLKGERVPPFDVKATAAPGPKLDN